MRGTPGKFRDDVYVRDEPFTDAAISEFVVTSDGLVLAQEEAPTRLSASRLTQTGNDSSPS